MIDLHMHSTASDGTDTPEEIITKCRKLGLTVCSITDHDTVDAQQPAKLAAGKRKLNYVTGVEFSVSFEGELHLLGYGIDVTNQQFVGIMEELRAYREGRIHSILEELRKHNVEVSFDEVKAFAGGNTLGRPHVAMALVRKGYAGDLQEAFQKYLNEGGLCYVKRRKLSADEAIGLIAQAGGVSVLAHPKFIRTDDIGALVQELTAQGLNGIEAYYPAHSDFEVKKYLQIANENNLLVTGGSDYHGKIRTYSAIASEKRTGPELEKTVQFLIEKYA